MSYIGQEIAQKIDQELMNRQTTGYSIDQLMELAGFSVAQVIAKQYPKAKRVLVLVGPGNNGGDALVAARHLKFFGYEPVVYYPKQPSKELYQSLVLILKRMQVKFIEELNFNVDLILDGFFGFSFKGEIREPFKTAIKNVVESKIKVVSIDIPSGWDVEKGDIQNCGLNPDCLISLTVPKKCAESYSGIHYVGGRFVPIEVAKQFNLSIPNYPGTDQCVLLK